ncbi:MAG: hypothetical protein ABIK62_03165 [candidate division WOR-3 bacterium]
MISPLMLMLTLTVPLSGTWESTTNTNFVNAICNLGDTLFLGTNGGLQPFCIKDSTFLPPLTNTEGLTSNLVRCCVTSRAGLVWCGTEGGGLVIVDPKTMTIALYPPDRLPLSINHLAVTGDTILVGSNNSITVVDTRGTDLDFSDDHYQNLSGLANSMIFALCPAGDIWVGTNQGIFRFGRDLTFRHYAMSPGDSVKAICVKDHSVFFASEAGIAQFDASAESLAPLVVFAEKRCVHALEAFEGTLVWASEYGVERLGPSGIETMWPGDSRALLSSQDLWVGLGSWLPELGGGIVRLRGQGLPNSTFYRTTIASNRIVALEAWSGPDGQSHGPYVCLSHFTFWGDRALSLRRPDGEWETIADTLINPCLVERDHRGRLWFGHWATYRSGLSVYDPDEETWQVIQWGASDYRNVIAALGIDRLDTRWVFNQTGEIIAIDSTGSQVSFHVPGVTPPPGGSYEFAFDSRDRVWLGTTAGLAMINYAGTLFDQTDDTTAFYSQGLQSTNVQSVALGPDDFVWVATNQGAARLEADAFKLFTTNNSGLLSNNVVRVRIDSWGNVWFLTDQGLCLYDPRRKEWSQLDANRGLIPNSTRRTTFYTWLELEEDSRSVVVGTQAGLSRFLFDSQGDTTLSRVCIQPNPFITGRHKSVTFTNLPADVQITVFDLAGQKVLSSSSTSDLRVNRTYRVGEWQTGPGGFLRDQRGRQIGSGSYLVVLRTGSAQRVLGLAVVR